MAKDARRGPFHSGFVTLLVALGLMTVYVGYMQIVPRLTVAVEGTVVAVQPDPRPNRNPKAEFRYVTPDGVTRTSKTYVTGGLRVAPGDTVTLAVLPHWPHFAYTQAHLQKNKDGRLTFILVWFGVLFAALLVRWISRRLAPTS